eukprot:scaffold35577_cov237-Amphora_coffeaeformis.AAC.1
MTDRNSHGYYSQSDGAPGSSYYGASISQVELEEEEFQDEQEPQSSSLSHTYYYTSPDPMSSLAAYEEEDPISIVDTMGRVEAEYFQDESGNGSTGYATQPGLPTTSKPSGKAPPKSQSVVLPRMASQMIPAHPSQESQRSQQRGYARQGHGGRSFSWPLLCCIVIAGPMLVLIGQGDRESATPTISPIPTVENIFSRPSAAPST